MSLDEYGKQKTWLLTGWEIGKPDARRQFSPNQTATQINPLFSRADLGASLSETNIAKLFPDYHNSLLKHVEPTAADMQKDLPGGALPVSNRGQSQAKSS